MKQTKTSRELEILHLQQSQLQDSCMDLHKLLHESDSLYQTRIRHLSEFSASLEMKIDHQTWELQNMVSKKVDIDMSTILSRIQCGKHLLCIFGLHSFVVMSFHELQGPAKVMGFSFVYQK